MATAPKSSSYKDRSSDDEFEDEIEKDSLTQEFEAASNHLRTLTETTTDSNILLYLYARYKQATEGQCNTTKPGMFDFRGKQKWEAWKSLGSLDRRRAMEEYIGKIRQLDPDWEIGIGKKEKAKSGSGGGFGVGVSRPMVEDNEGRTTSNWLDCVKEGNLELLKALSSTSSDLLKEKDETGMTALHWATDRGHLNIIEYLIKKSEIDLNAQDASGQTPLHYAYMCGHDHVITILKEAGADQSILDNDGNKPRDLA